MLTMYERHRRLLRRGPATTESRARVLLQESDFRLPALTVFGWSVQLHLQQHIYQNKSSVSTIHMLMFEIVL